MEVAAIFRLFDIPEAMVADKNKVISFLYESAPLYTHFFRHAQKSPLRNPDRRKTGRRLTLERKLEDFTVYSTLHLLLGTALLDDPEETMSILLPVVISNYGLLEEDAEDLLQSLLELSQEPIILSFQEKMRKHRDGLLRTMQFKDVMDLYRRHLTPRFYEKKNLGQVFTPFVLINKLLDQIPDYVMRNPASKFLDPSAGMGGFLVVLYHRLMTSLAHVIPNERKRHDHIIGNMLYGAELTKNNVAMMRRIFGDGLHVYHGDALKMDTKKVFGVEKFQVVVGNPPFEKPQKKETKRTGGDSLWPEFVRKSLDEWLMPDGYLGMLLPPGWRKPQHDGSTTSGLWDKMSKRVQWVQIYDIEDSKELFGGSVSIRFDLVFLHNNEERTRKTLVRGLDGKEHRVSLWKWPFLPNSNLRFWKSRLTLNTGEAVGLVYSGSTYHNQNANLRKTKVGNYRHRVIHAIHKDNSRVYLYTNERKRSGGFGVPKLIFNGFGGWNEPVLDKSGSFGMSNVVYAIPVKSDAEGEAMLTFFKRPGILQMFDRDMAWGTSKPLQSWRLFNHLRRDFYR